MEVSQSALEEAFCRSLGEGSGDTERRRFWSDFERWLGRPGHSVVPLSAIPRLKALADPPPLLFVRGDPGVLTMEGVTIVGTRRARPRSLSVAWRLGRDFAQLGLAVVSGLARGIDSAAHRGALAGEGKTVAVLGSGLERLYPRENRGLADEIVERGGCVASEYFPHTPPRKHQFPARNRILAGLTGGTVVVEAARGSGSLITARLALDNHREVFALPGAFGDTGFAGNHDLIQQGAKLVTGIEDIVGELVPVPRWVAPEALEPLRRTFGRLQGVATLAGLVEAGGDDGLALLQRALEEGYVIALSPQRYAWVAD